MEFPDGFGAEAGLSGPGRVGIIFVMPTDICQGLPSYLIAYVRLHAWELVPLGLIKILRLEESRLGASDLI